MTMKSRAFLLLFFLISLKWVVGIDSEELLSTANFEDCEKWNYEILRDSHSELSTDAPSLVTISSSSTVCLNITFISLLKSGSDDSITITSKSPDFFTSIATKRVNSTVGSYILPYLKSVTLQANSSLSLEFVTFTQGEYLLSVDDSFAFLKISVTDDTSSSDIVTFNSTYGDRDPLLDEDDRNDGENSVWSDFTSKSLEIVEEAKSGLSYLPHLTTLSLNSTTLLTLLQRKTVQGPYSLSSLLFRDSIVKSVEDNTMTLTTPFLSSFSFHSLEASQEESSIVYASQYRMMRIYFIPMIEQRYVINGTTQEETSRGLTDTIHVLNNLDALQPPANLSLLYYSQNTNHARGMVVFGLIIMAIVSTGVFLSLVNIFLFQK